MADLAMGILATIDLCLRYGSLIVSKAKTYKNAKAHVTELILRIEGVWIKMEHQIRSLGTVASLLDTRLLDYFDLTLHNLYAKLQAAHNLIDRVIGSKQATNVQRLDVTAQISNWSRAKVMFSEKNLEKVVADLESWHRIFDPSWFLLALEPTPAVDERLADDRTLEPSKAIAWVKATRDARKPEASHPKPVQSLFFVDFSWVDNISPIPYSNALSASDHRTRNSLILDTTTYPFATNLEVAQTHVHDIARVFATVDSSSIGLLRCRGFRKIPPTLLTPPNFQLVFEVPTGAHSPKSLRQRLLEEKEATLDERLHLAQSLARAVLFVHTAGFVHKNVRPETILLFSDARHPTSIKPFLLGFERFRLAAAGTNLISDALWEQNLYRHPERQGTLAEKLYVMQHDIYSLGVCLLELGLWTPFVVPPGSLGTRAPTRLSPHPGSILPILSFLDMKDKRKAALEIKKTLTALAQAKLPFLTGNTYAEIVTACLTCLDRGPGNMFAERAEVEDDDGIIVGVHFIEKVFARLEEIRL
ncbi:hypothetical protein MMC11_005168 [Xylographa trunciseda]|nr:hypothetical protein [Xylographa trunciseda]